MIGRLDTELRRLGGDVPPDHCPPPIAQPGDAVEARSRARPVSQGGPFVRLLADEVERASAPTRGGPPLAGVPFAVKDLMAVRGQPIGAGSALRDDAPPEPVDAGIVQRLRALGAVPVGLTALHEFAFGGTGVNHHLGTVRNPADDARIAGGSSSGSTAAVADGTVPFALGTDTGGSVRIPAALCGVVGFKPALRRYPTAGVLPLAPTLDHVGLLARDLGVVIAVHRALGHPVAEEATLRRVGVVRAELEAASAPVRDRVEALLHGLLARGVAVTDVAWPVGEEVFATSTAIMYAEAAAVHERDLEARPEAYGDDVRERLEQGRQLRATTYLAALRQRDVLQRRTRQVLDDVDVVVGPTVAVTAPLLEVSDTPEVRAELVRCTRLANVTGDPVLSLPLPGPGLPVGVQVTGADEGRLLALATQLLAAAPG